MINIQLRCTVCNTPDIFHLEEVPRTFNACCSECMDYLPFDRYEYYYECERCTCLHHIPYAEGLRIHKVCPSCGVDYFHTYAGAVNPTPPNKEKATRYNSNKLEFTHIHPAMYTYLAKVGYVGSKKYPKGNYLKGGKPASEYIDSATRHLMRLMAGEIKDKESGQHHGAHIAWNMLMLCWALDTGLSDLDTLPTADMGVLEKLLTEDTTNEL